MNNMYLDVPYERALYKGGCEIGAVSMIMRYYLGNSAPTQAIIASMGIDNIGKHRFGRCTVIYKKMTHKEVERTVKNGQPVAVRVRTDWRSGIIPKGMEPFHVIVIIGIKGNKRYKIHDPSGIIFDTGKQTYTKDPNSIGKWWPSEMIKRSREESGMLAYIVECKV